MQRLAFRSWSLIAVMAALVAAGLRADARTLVRPWSGPAALHRTAVFGRDDRVILPTAQSTLRGQIGILYEPRSRSVCTAFCVARDIIATAAHCLYRTSDERPLGLEAMSFRLGLRNKAQQTRIAGAEAREENQNVMSGSMRLSIRPPIDTFHDWALVRLVKPVCAAGGLKLGRYSPAEVEKLAAEGRVYEVGFHRDFRNWELALSKCDMDAGALAPLDRGAVARDFINVDELVLHMCDTGGASSGSPLLVDGPSGPEVVAMNVGTYVRSRVVMHDDRVLKRYRPDNVANTGVSAVPLAARLAIFAKAPIITGREHIRELQVALEHIGYPAGKPDGVYGPSLKAAIEAYEKAQGVAVTGLATEALLKRLVSSPSAARAGSAP